MTGTILGGTYGGVNQQHAGARDNADGPHSKPYLTFFVSQKRASLLKKAAEPPAQGLIPAFLPRFGQDFAVKSSTSWTPNGSEVASEEFFNRLERFCDGSRGFLCAYPDHRRGVTLRACASC
jgi:hypothetical protein